MSENKELPVGFDAVVALAAQDLFIHGVAIVRRVNGAIERVDPATIRLVVVDPLASIPTDPSCTCEFVGVLPDVKCPMHGVVPPPPEPVGRHPEAIRARKRRKAAKEG
jgi:hypothetical protein